MKSTLIKLTLALGVLLVVFSLIGYSGQFSSTIDQSKVCLFESDETAKQCKEGQLSFFQPSTFGNEQMPLARRKDSFVVRREVV